LTDYKHLKQIFSKSFTRIILVCEVKPHPHSPDTKNQPSSSQVSSRVQFLRAKTLLTRPLIALAVSGPEVTVLHSEIVPFWLLCTLIIFSNSKQYQPKTSSRPFATSECAAFAGGWNPRQAALCHSHVNQFRDNRNEIFLQTSSEWSSPSAATQVGDNPCPYTRDKVQSPTFGCSHPPQAVGYQMIQGAFLFLVVSLRLASPITKEPRLWTVAG